MQNILKKYGVYQNINNLDLYQEAMVHESYTIGKIKEVCSRGDLDGNCVVNLIDFSILGQELMQNMLH